MLTFSRFQSDNALAPEVISIWRSGSSLGSFVLPCYIKPLAVQSLDIPSRRDLVRTNPFWPVNSETPQYL